MADGYVVREDRRNAGICVNDRAVLHVAAVTHNEPLVVAAKHAVEPDTRPTTQAYTADHLRTWRDVEIVICRFESAFAKGVDHRDSSVKDQRWYTGMLPRFARLMR